MALHSPKRPPSLVVSLQLSPGEPSPSPLSAEPEWAKALEAGALVVEGSATTATASAVICIVGAPQEVLSEAFTSTGNDDALNTGSQKGQGQAGNGNGTDDDDDDNTPLDRLSATATATTTPAARQPRQSIQPILATIPITLADPFSLDAYSLLLRRHARIGKDLLLARVTTVSAGRLFHDVYEAHAINKVLFRTQPEEGLLHRMKSRNPLNNLEIVGDVWYYRVSVLDIRRGIEDLKKKAQRESILKEKQLSCADKLAPPSATNGHRRFSLAAVATTALEAAAELVSPVIHGHGSHRRASSSYVPVETVIRTLPSPVTVEDSERSSPLGGQPKERFSPIKSAGSGGRKSPSSGMSPPSGPIIFRAEFFGTDDDFLMKAAVRAYFKESALEPSDALLFPLSVPQPHEIPGAAPHPALPGYLYTLDPLDPAELSNAQRLRYYLFRTDTRTIGGRIFTPLWRTIAMIYLFAAVFAVRFAAAGASASVVYVGVGGIALVCLGSFIWIWGR